MQLVGYLYEDYHDAGSLEHKESISQIEAFQEGLCSKELILTPKLNR